MGLQSATGRGRHAAETTLGPKLARALVEAGARVAAIGAVLARMPRKQMALSDYAERRKRNPEFSVKIAVFALFLLVWFAACGYDSTCRSDAGCRDDEYCEIKPSPPSFQSGNPFPPGEDTYECIEAVECGEARPTCRCVIFSDFDKCRDDEETTVIVRATEQ